jgi:GH25 family lysozyme M1 (1,4-beta-N-acetylmuramidase)
MKNYSLIIDVSEHQGTVDWAILKQGVAAVIIRINSNDGTTIHKDLKFDQFWAGAKAAGLIVSPYIYYDPELGNGQAHYVWLVANMPAGCTTIFADIEQVQAGLDPTLYGVEVNKFLQLCQTRWKTIIYTGAWFLPNMTNWSTTLDYWWSAYPASMYPQTPLKQSWSELDTKIQGLSWPAWNWKACPGEIKLWQCSGDRLIIPGSSGTMDINVFPGSASEYSAWIESEDYMNVLQVPYVSQIVPGALMHNNDCGAASALLVLRAYQLANDTTVDQIYDKIQPSGDTALSAGGMMTLLASYGIKNQWVAGVHIHDMYDPLVARCPIVALIHYAPLVKAGLTEKTGFLGAHFVVVIGMDVKYIYIHDPYTTGAGCTAVPVAVFEQCWAEAELDGNPDHAAIVMTLGIQDLSNPASQPIGIKYALNVNGINVRYGPGSTFALVKTLWKVSTPTVVIVKVSGDWGQLSDLSGWVYVPYLNIA